MSKLSPQNDFSKPNYVFQMKTNDLPNGAGKFLRTTRLNSNTINFIKFLFSVISP